MPSFPTSVFSPTTKSAGQVIQPAHINDLQDEIVAIESGYLTGAAPLNSSNSTVLNLSVAGGSTFAGPVTFSTTATFSTIVRFVSPSAVVKHGSTTNLADSVWTGLNWDTQDWSNAAMHSTSANSSRITFADSTGLYAVYANVSISTRNSNAPVLGRIMYNDAQSAFIASGTPSSVLFTSLICAGHLRVQSTTDYITVQVHSVNSTAHILANSTLTPRVFSAQLVSR